MEIIMKKRLLASLLAAMMMVSMLATTAFAAGPVADEEPEVYSVTVSAADLLAFGESSMSKTVAPSLGLSGGAAWSLPVTARFSTIPADATVVKIKASLGKPTYSGSITGVISVDRFRLTAPDGNSVELARSTIASETTALNGIYAKGDWQLSIYGLHVGSGYSAIKFPNATITIYYTV